MSYKGREFAFTKKVNFKFNVFLLLKACIKKYFYYLVIFTAFCCFEELNLPEKHFFHPLKIP